MDVWIEDGHGGKPVLVCKTEKGTRYLDPDSVFVRASDGVVFVSGGGVAGPLRDGIEPAEEAMIAQLPLVKRLLAKEPKPEAPAAPKEPKKAAKQKSSAKPKTAAKKTTAKK